MMASRAADVASAIGDASLCCRCIALKSGAALARLGDLIGQPWKTVIVTMSLAPCDGCQRDTLLYRIGRPDQGSVDKP